MIRIPVLIALFALSCLIAGRADAALISNYDYEYHVVGAGNYVGAPSDAAQLYFSVNGIDGVTYSGTASAAGSSTVGRSTLGAPDANTVVMSRQWEISRAANAPAPDGNITRSGSSFWFTATENLDYTIFGGYDISGGNATLQLLLFDRTNPAILGVPYYSLRDSSSAGHFEAPGLGGPGTFPLTGTLLKDHIYEFGHQFWSNGVDDGAEISGEVSLRLSRMNSVPEPASLTLFGLGAVGLAFSRRRRACRADDRQIT